MVTVPSSSAKVDPGANLQKDENPIKIKAILDFPWLDALGTSAANKSVKSYLGALDDQIVAREMTNLSLSLDHRVVDGAVGADFLYAVIARLADPAAWLDPEELG